MKLYTKMAVAAACVAFLAVSCEEKEQGGTTSGDTFFAKGADISWLTQMESEGMKFYNSYGAETECTKVIKDAGFNSVRYRVWVNPEGKWNTKEDVLEKALRAQQLGMKIMIDFHYSDSWADPGKQNPPAAWADYDIDALVDAVAGHTTEVLTLLKDNGVDVEWVQAGNETTTGMLWPLGKYTTEGGKNYARLTTAAYDAAKAVYPDCKVVVHLDQGQDITRYKTLLPILISGGGKFDIIGMSLYPCWWDAASGAFTTDWEDATMQCISNIPMLANLYNKPVMICEVGMPASLPELSKEMLTYLLSKTRNMKTCLGVFYWEPQAPDGYNGGYGLGAFKDGRPTAALAPFRN
ncbi:MAG: arabinogalactan endo-beta-1,4-galactanase [Candidatus Cryptobacteroides sp.]